MEVKHLQKIHERLRIIQLAYSHVYLEAVLDAKRFLEILEKNIILSEIPTPADISAEDDGSVCIDWFKVSPEQQLDLFSIYLIGDGSLVYEAFLDSLGTSLRKTTEMRDDRDQIKEELDEILLIHIKHFN